MAVPPPAVRTENDPLVRPREAATLIVYRKGRRSLEVLMGERHRKHSFMPQRYVFPGGRVDPGDSRVRVATQLREHVAAQLQRKLSAARARAMGVAAIRETFEEAGLIIGAPDPSPERKPPKDWQGFFATGMAPALDRLEYIARAVTPPFRPQRFNARFFMVDEQYVAGDLSGSGELENLRWFPIHEAVGLELPNITHKVLTFIEERVENPPPPAADTLVPFFKHTPQGHIRFDE